MVLLEGIGCSDSDERNAVKKANMEYLNSLKANENCVYRELDASGACVDDASALPHPSLLLERDVTRMT